MQSVQTTRHRSDTRVIDNRSEWTQKSVVVDTGEEFSVYDRSGSIGDGTYVSRDMYDNITPDYYSLQKEGGVVMNDMQQTKQVVILDTKATGSMSANFGWYDKYVDIDLSAFHCFDGLIFPSLPLINDTRYDSDVAIATTRLHAQIQDAPLDLLTSAMELHKSVRTLNHSFRAVVSLLKRLRKLKKLNLAGALDASKLASGYLEVRYGLRPIYYDIKGAVEALSGLKDGTLRSVLHINHEVSKSTHDWVKSKTIGASSWTLNTQWNVHDSEAAYIRAGAVLDFQGREMDIFDQLDLDAVQTAWELVPFSFIADWFLNIGDVLASWTPKYDVTIAGTYLTLEETYRRSIFASSVYSSDLKRYCDDLSHNGTHAKSVRTRRYGNPSKPWLPRINIRLDGLKLLDVMAILHGYKDDLRRLRI